MKEGMEVGDVVMALNDKSVNELTQSEVQRILKRASGNLRIFINRNARSTLPDVDGGSGEHREELEPILREPKPSPPQQQHYRRRRAGSILSESTETANQIPSSPALMTRSVSSMSNTGEYLYGFTKPPLPWSTSAHSSRYARQWAPLNFSPLSPAQSPHPKDAAEEPMEYSAKPFKRNQIRSAPVTPSSPLSPAYPTNYSEHQDTKQNELSLHSDLIVEKRDGFSVDKETATKKALIDDDRDGFDATPPNFASTISSTSTPSTVVDEATNLRDPNSLAVTNAKLRDQQIRNDSSINFGGNIFENVKIPSYNDNYNNAPMEQDSLARLPDEIAFRPDSSTSDHPSLATTSLVDMESVSGSQVADSEQGFDGTAAVDVPNMPDEVRVSDHPLEGPFYAEMRRYDNRQRQTLPVIYDVSSSNNTTADQQAMAESVSLNHSGLKDSNSTFMTDSVSFADELSALDSSNKDRQLQATPASDQVSTSSENKLGSNEPHYPMAFTPTPLPDANNVQVATGNLTFASSSTTQHQPPQLFEVSNETTTTASMMSGSLYHQPYSTTGFMGPSFKAPTTAAVWSPGGKPAPAAASASFNADSTHAQAKKFDSTLLSPLSPYSSSLHGYSPVSFNPPAEPKVSSSSTNTTGFGAREFQQISPPKPSAPIFSAPPPPPPSQSFSSLLSPSSSNHNAVPAPPPPPPPPAPGVVTRLPLSDKNQLTAEELAIAADPNRSVVEIPERQSVASLRSAIETKLNGSSPVKGVFPTTTDSDTPILKLPAVSSASEQSYKAAAPIESPAFRPSEPIRAPSGLNINDTFDLVSSAVEGLKHAVFEAQHTSPVKQTRDKLETAVDVLDSNKISIDSSPTSSSIAHGFYSKLSTNATSESDTFLTSTPSQYWSGSRAPFNIANAPPVRPPPPMDLKSPTPPAIPPSPVRISGSSGRVEPVQRPYSENSFRNDSYNIVRTDRSPPRGSTLLDRKSTVENDQIHTDSYFSTPYRETQTTQRHIKQSDMKYAGVGPVDDRGTPLGLKQHLAEKGLHHEWYKMMYKKLHQIDKNEDESVLRYQMRDYLGDRYVNENIANRRRNDEENNPYTVSYKFADYVNDADMDYDPGYVPKAYQSSTLPRNSRVNDKNFPMRSMRSKSAGRYEVAASSPPKEIIRSTTPGDSRYKHQPKRIEDYVPGTSSIAEYEQEKISKEVEENNNNVIVVHDENHQRSTTTRPAINDNDDGSFDPTTLKNRVIAELIGKHRTNAARPQSSLAYTSTSRFFGATDEDSFVRRRHDLSPPSRDEARQWYRNVQSGGEVPIAGLRQIAPERRDSWLRTALLTTLKHKRNLNVVEKRECAIQTCDDALLETLFHSPTKKSTGKRHLSFYGSYWKRAFQAAPSNEKLIHYAPLYVDTDLAYQHCVDDDDMRPSNSSNSFFSPIYNTVAGGGSKLYAYERMRSKDFHIPEYRRTPPTTGNGGSKSVDYEIEAYFDYLKMFCEEENERLTEKASQCDTASTKVDFAQSPQMRLQPWTNNYEKSLQLQRMEQRNFDKTFSELQKAVRDIEVLTTANLLMNGARPRDTSLSPRRRAMKRSNSLPLALSSSPYFGQSPGTRSPHKSILKNTDRTRAAAAGVLSLTGERAVDVDRFVYFPDATRQQTTRQNVLKRINSLPQISDAKLYLFTATQHSKSMDTFSVLGKRENSEVSSADDANVSLESDVMEITFDDEGRVKLLRMLDDAQRIHPVSSAQYAPAVFYPSRTVWSDVAKRPFVPYKTPNSLDFFGRSSSIPNLPKDLRATSASVHIPAVGYRTSVYRPPSTGMLDCMFDVTPTSNVSYQLFKYAAIERSGPRHETSASHFRSLSNSPFADSPHRADVGQSRFQSTRNYDVKTDYNVEDLAKLEKELVVEEERRKKYEREIEDQRSRRHGYIPMQIKTPILGDNRFEKLINEYSTNRPTVSSPAQNASSVALTSNSRGVARAIYSFTANSPRELSFFKGDLIKIRRIIDENWLEGEINGRVGIIPSNYVDTIALTESSERVVMTEVSKSAEGQGQVMFGFDGRKVNELPLVKNEYITLLRKIDNNWYEGRNDMGRRGIFPVNYVRIIREPSSQTKDFVSAFSPPRAVSAAPSLRPDFKMQVNGVQFDKRDKPSNLNKVLNNLPSMPFTFKSIDSKAQESSFSLREQKQDFTRSILHQKQPDTYEALYAYVPQNPDELELKEGDLVFVVEKCDDGWYIGSSMRNGKFGTFPGNYVKLR